MLLSKSISEEQRRAARSNGAKSHGPVTAEGKKHSAASSRQRMLARTILLTGESRALFEALYQSFFDDILPESPIELAMVEKMTVSHWRQMRAWSFEKTSSTARDRDEGARDEAVGDFHTGSPRHAVPAPAPLALHSYENTCDRVFSRSLNLILKLRAARAKPALALPESTITSAPTQRK